MKDNNKLKQEFFACYWNQEVYSKRGANWVDHFYSLDYIDDEDLLVLKSLSSISDQDAIEVAKLAYSGKESHSVEAGKNLVKCITSDDVMYGNSTVWLLITDYLRSKGYLLPFREYTTDQLIEMGWVKLRTT